MNAAEVFQGLEEIKVLISREVKNVGDEASKKYFEAIDQAKKALALCLTCYGRGVIFYTSPNHGSGFTVRKLRGSVGLVHEYRCTHCKGTGQRLTDSCVSCTREYRPEAKPRFKQIEMLFPDRLCSDCFNAQDKKIGVILPEPVDQEETKKAESPVVKKGGKK
jgi:hypothetical protein